MKVGDHEFFIDGRCPLCGSRSGTALLNGESWGYCSAHRRRWKCAQNGSYVGLISPGQLVALRVVNGIYSKVDLKDVRDMYRSFFEAPESPGCIRFEESEGEA